MQRAHSMAATLGSSRRKPTGITPRLAPLLASSHVPRKQGASQPAADVAEPRIHIEAAELTPPPTSGAPPPPTPPPPPPTPPPLTEADLERAALTIGAPQQLKVAVQQADRSKDGKPVFVLALELDGVKWTVVRREDTAFPDLLRSPHVSSDLPRSPNSFSQLSSTAPHITYLSLPPAPPRRCAARRTSSSCTPPSSS